MTSFEKKYLEYKTMYLKLKERQKLNKSIQKGIQSGGSTSIKKIDILDISNLTDTPINNKQSGGTKDLDILELSNLSDTPTNNKLNTTMIGGKSIDKFLPNNLNDFDLDSISNSSSFTLSSSTDSLLSALEDTDSISKI